MTAAIGPLAIFLITNTESPVIMRHPYKRIVKWIAHADKHIFAYWVIKPMVSHADSLTIRVKIIIITITTR